MSYKHYSRRAGGWACLTESATRRPVQRTLSVLNETSTAVSLYSIHTYILYIYMRFNNKHDTTVTPRNWPWLTLNKYDFFFRTKRSKLFNIIRFLKKKRNVYLCTVGIKLNIIMIIKGNCIKNKWDFIYDDKFMLWAVRQIIYYKMYFFLLLIIYDNLWINIRKIMVW